MKKTLLILTTFLISIISFATDNWPGVCENLELTYTMNGTSNPLIFKMNIFVKNNGSTDIEQYCDISEVFQTPGVIILDSTYNPSCYPVLKPGETKEIKFSVYRDNTSIPKYDLKFKIKNIDGDKFCTEVTDHWFNAPMNIEEIDRTEMEFSSTYYDLMGREVAQPNTKGFYIFEKLFEDGYKTVEKIYLTEPTVLK